jgi:MFS family permease
MQAVVSLCLVFLGGFAIMVLEIVGARFLMKDFGGSFYVWVSQIGVILIALAIGYAAGGFLSDRFQRARFLLWLLLPAAFFTAAIPHLAGPLLEAITLRHPPELPIPVVWQKWDPALGSALIFFLPCVVLATLCPYMIRLTSRRLTHVGRMSGLMFASSTVGSIAGVFISGYYLLDHFRLSQIFHGTACLIAGLGFLCWAFDHWIQPAAEISSLK